MKKAAEIANTIDSAKHFSKIKTLGNNLLLLTRNDQILFPVLIFIIMALSLGLLLPDLGFYMDDWPKIFFQQIKGSESTHLFSAHDGRPLQGWYQILLFHVFGTTAWMWQLYALIIRYLTVIFFWLTFRKIWSGAEIQIGLASVLFAVYPIFAQQPMTVSFTLHWTSFLCLMLSTYLMVQSINHPRYYLPLTIIAIFISGLGLILIEYFVGLEFVRLLLLWFIFSQRTAIQQKRFSLTALHFIPYLLSTGIYMIWRIFFIHLPVADRNHLSLIDKLFTAPVQTITDLTQTVFQDFATMVVAGWYKTFQPQLFVVNGPIDIAAIAIPILTAIILFFALVKNSRLDESVGKEKPKVWLQMLLTGFFIMLLGAMPGWLINRQLSDFTGLWDDRFGLAAMPGAALIVIVSIWKIATQYRTRIVLVAILVGLASGWQIRNMNDWRWSWDYQKRLFNQFLW